MLSNKLNVNGSEIRLDESSVLPNMTVVPPAVELASTKAAPPGAMFVLAASAVTVNVGPLTDWPKTVTVIGPVDAPYGTSTSMRVRDASAILTGIPLKARQDFRCVSQIRCPLSQPGFLAGRSGVKR